MFIREHSLVDLASMVDLANMFNMAHNVWVHEKEKRDDIHRIREGRMFRRIIIIVETLERLHLDFLLQMFVLSYVINQGIRQTIVGYNKLDHLFLIRVLTVFTNVLLGIQVLSFHLMIVQSTRTMLELWLQHTYSRKCMH